MNIIELMDSRFKSYTKTDIIIYNACKKNPRMFAQAPISELISFLQVSQPALTRFAKRLDFSGFNEFQFQLAQSLNEIENTPRTATLSQKYARVLKSTEETIPKEQIRRIAEKIMNSENIYLHGASLSQVPAMWLTIGLQISGAKHAQLLELDRFSYRFTENDTVIIFSVSGRASSIAHRYPAIGKEHKSFNILVTMNPRNPDKDFYDEIVLLPDSQAVYGSESACSDTMAFMMFNEILVSSLDS